MTTELKQQTVVVSTIDEMRKISESFRGQTLGLVPTMGYLHEGHLSLVKQSLEKCDHTVVSIFVNPRQFGPKEDLDIYPQDLSGDLEKLESLSVDVVFNPDRQTIYPEGFKTHVQVDEITRNLCGKSRPQFFKGVATVVLKLFNIVRPQYAFFGEKDWQQLAVIETMTRDLNMDVEIHRVPLMREPDGLAMSSRNSNLSPEERKQALSLSRSLKDSKEKIQQGIISSKELRQNIRNIISAEPGTQIDYISICDPVSLEEKEIIKGRTLIALAVKIGPARLIDNCIIED
ncbi:MAG: pantoate--beta-alanine ligase [Nitrospinae bacterium]|nr:pantoate--beta-alanine ligase [Nitrospinota bacterium]MZH03781.1 pantoate--beta-alanine ligase [Nitrospinota bacterium]MZH15441.1 pantoate--beta-alanine ligase [Nitrospinota bacterium]